MSASLSCTIFTSVVVLLTISQLQSKVAGLAQLFNDVTNMRASTDKKARKHIEAVKLKSQEVRHTDPRPRCVAQPSPCI